MSANPLSTFEGFSVSHAAILDGSTAAATVLSAPVEGDNEFDIYGVRDASLTTDEGNFDNTGDDATLSSWFWFNHVNVSVKSGYISFALVADMSGATMTTSSGVGGTTYSMPIWESEGMNQPQKPMIIRIPSKDANGDSRNLDVVLYKVQFAPIKFEGPTYKSGLVVDYSGRAMLSLRDEVGNNLTRRAIGRIINSPA